SVTSYWAHPAALASFPPAELAWMVLSPAALLFLATGAVQLVRRLDLSPRVLRYETWIGRAAAGGMTALLAGALCWGAQAGPGPPGVVRDGGHGRGRVGGEGGGAGHGLAGHLAGRPHPSCARRRSRVSGGPPVSEGPPASAGRAGRLNRRRVLGAGLC